MDSAPKLGLYSPYSGPVERGLSLLPKATALSIPGAHFGGHEAAQVQGYIWTTGIWNGDFLFLIAHQRQHV